MRRRLTGLEQLARRPGEAVGLRTDPVGVHVLRAGAGAGPCAGSARVSGHRYCQALMRARRDGQARLGPQEIASPAAAFGFRALRQSLASGQGLVGFGIVERILERARCSVAFEMERKLSGGS